MDNQGNNQIPPVNNEPTPVSPPPFRPEPRPPLQPQPRPEQPTEPQSSTPTPSPFQPQPQPESQLPPAAEPHLSSLSQFDSTPTVPVVPPPAPKRRGRLIAIIIAVVLVVLCAGAALAYTFWYQNPEKVVTDGIIHAIKAKSVSYTGSLSLDGPQKIKVEVSGASEGDTGNMNVKLTMDYEGKDLTLDGSGVLDSKGDLYFKIKNVDTIVDTFLAQQFGVGSDPKLSKLINEFVAKINDQWIKVSADDMKTVSEDAANSQKCMREAIEKIEKDESATSEISETYKKHKFILISNNLGTKDGSMGYELTADKEIAKAFVSDLKNTQLYKAMKDCDKDFTLGEDELFKESTDDKEVVKVQIWVSQFAHQITKFSVDATGTYDDGTKKSENKFALLFEPTFNEKVTTIATPDKSTTIKQLQSDIQDLFATYMGVSYGLEDSSDEL